jgi:hypothetical protein
MNYNKKESSYVRRMIAWYILFGKYGNVYEMWKAYQKAFCNKALAE